jgi:hypothetical protein
MDRLEHEAPAASQPVSQPAPRMARYLAIWAGALVAMLGTVVALCGFVDPYAIFGTPRIAGLTANKPAAADWPRVTKAYMVQRAHPTTLIIGNSTADVGFNPDSPAWPAAARPVFNLAIDGGLPRTHLRYLQHALYVTAPTHVVISVNFTESLILPQRKLSAAVQDQFAFEPRMLVLPDGEPNPDYRNGHIADLVFATLSFTALSDSITTLLSQNNPDATYETEAGWNNGGKFHRWEREDGFYSVFMNKDREKIPQFMRWRDHKIVDIDPVIEMVKIARAHHADVTVVIIPNHADEMDALRQLGLDADYDAWKTAIVDGVTKAAPDGGATIWDFSGYTPYTTEPVPAPGDHSHTLRWFYEPVHFQPTLGDLMIARIEGAPAPDNFGTILTPATLPAQIAAFHAAEAAWVSGHPRDVARISAVIGTGAK